MRCYEPRISVRQCAAMSHCDLNIEMTGVAGLFGMFTKNTALCAFATALRSRHFALACLHFRATVLRERHVASLHALARVLKNEYICCPNNVPQTHGSLVTHATSWNARMQQ